MYDSFQNWRKQTQKFENSSKGSVPLQISEHQKPAAKCSGNAFGARFLSETLSATGKISEINQIYPVPQQAGQKVSKSDKIRPAKLSRIPNI